LTEAVKENIEPHLKVKLDYFNYYSKTKDFYSDLSLNNSKIFCVKFRRSAK